MGAEDEGDAAWPNRRSWCIATAIFAACSTFVWFPGLAAYPDDLFGNSLSDAIWFQHTLDTMSVTVTRFHELPLWNPYGCGGAPLWDNPQSAIGSPLAWLAFVVGPTLTQWSWLWVHFVAACLCMWLFARVELGLSWVAAVASAIVWGFSGFNTAHAIAGHAAHAPFAFLPLALLLSRRAERMPYGVALGILYALMFYEGAVYPIPIVTMVLGLEAVMRMALHPKRMLAVARGVAVAVATFAGLAAARLIPVAFQIAGHERNLGRDTDVWSLHGLLVALTSKHGRAPGHWGWHEYFAYVGAAALIGAGIGAFGVRRDGAARRHAWLLVLGACAILIVLGCYSPHAPWPFLNEHVFPFKQMRVPSRFVVVIVLVVAAYFGIAIDSRLARTTASRGSRGRDLLLLGAFLACGDVLACAEGDAEGAFTNRRPASVEPSARLYLGAKDNLDMRQWARANTARVEPCGDEWGFGKTAPYWMGDLPQARCEDEPTAVRDVLRTPNTFTFVAEASKPIVVKLNSAYDPGWRTNVGSVREQDKLLVLDLPPGSHTVRVRYWPRGFTAGLACTAATIAALVGAIMLRRRRAAAAA